MANKAFFYQDPFPLAKDDTEYYLLTNEHVSVSEFEGQEILKVAPEALTLVAQQAFHDAAFLLRTSHQKQVARITSYNVCYTKLLRFCTRYFKRILNY